MDLFNLVPQMNHSRLQIRQTILLQVEIIGLYVLEILIHAFSVLNALRERSMVRLHHTFGNYLSFKLVNFLNFTSGNTVPLCGVEYLYSTTGAVDDQTRVACYPTTGPTTESFYLVSPTPGKCKLEAFRE